MFVHLRVRSDYSLLEGAIKIHKLIDKCVQTSAVAVALTDSSNLYGSLEFSQTAINKGIKPIIGISIIIKYSDKCPPAEILILAKDQGGYSNLLDLTNRSFINNIQHESKYITIADLTECSAGLIVLTGGSVNGILAQSMREKVDAISMLHRIFPESLYIELQRCSQDYDSELEKKMIDIAYMKNIPIVATNDVYFLTRDMHLAHDALLCVSEGRYLSEENRKKVTEEHYLKSKYEMRELFSDLPEAIENTVNIAIRCNVEVPKRDPVLPKFGDGDILEEDKLREDAFSGLAEKLANSVYSNDMGADEKKQIREKYVKRLEYEIDVILSMQYAGYFLIVSDFIKWSKNNEVAVGPGRGSGAGSLVAWVLYITDVDPIRFGLIFERFLNPERVSMPDFDIDFCQENRDRVIQYVVDKYGSNYVAQIITFGKLQPRAVIRDVGRVLQMPYPVVDKICKMIPNNPAKPVTLTEAIKLNDALQRERRENGEMQVLLDVGLKLEGLYRHASVHAAGIVISHEPIKKLIPICYDIKSNIPITQYTMKYVEMSGLVKFDFLGLKTLTLIDQICKLIRKRVADFEISNTLFNDSVTYQMLSKGDSFGVFQLESAGMQDALCKLKPDNIEEIIALISLYRPGPMENIPKYVACKHGKESPDYLHPMLEEILKETFGVIIYQEQVMQIARTMSGYSLGEADLLRRAMGKKIKEEMDKQRDRFVTGALKNNVSKEQAVYIFDLVAKFAGYGFNKSHATAYAIISYQTAYLKANYLIEFFIVSLNMDINNTDKLYMFCHEIKAAKITILSPDINESDVLFKIESESIRYSLMALKNIGMNVAERIVKERRENGAFKDIWSFLERMDPSVINKKSLECLALSGAFNSIYPNSKQLYKNVEELAKFNAVLHSEKISNQLDIFSCGYSGEKFLPKLEDANAWSSKEILANEYSAIGFYLTGHPLDEYSILLPAMGVSSIKDVSNSDHKHAKIAGAVVKIRISSTPRGIFAVISISDTSNLVDITIYDQGLIDEHKDELVEGALLLFDVSIKKDESGLRLFGKGISDLKHVTAANYTLCIELSNIVELDKLHSLLIRNDLSGSNKVMLKALTSDESKVITIELPGLYSLGNRCLQGIRCLDGVSNIVVT